MGRNTVLVEWGIPESDGGAPIDGYTIALRDVSRTMWIQVGRVDPDNQKITIKEMQVGFFGGEEKPLGGDRWGVPREGKSRGKPEWGAQGREVQVENPSGCPKGKPECGAQRGNPSGSYNAYPIHARWYLEDEAFGFLVVIVVFESFQKSNFKWNVSVNVKAS